METQVENAFSSDALAKAFIQNILQKTSFENVNEAKRFIDAIYYRRNQGEYNSRTIAQTLESNIRTVFNSSHKYIYELLQNPEETKREKLIKPDIKALVSKQIFVYLIKLQYFQNMFASVLIKKVLNNHWIIPGQLCQFGQTKMHF